MNAYSPHAAGADVSPTSTPLTSTFTLTGRSGRSARRRSTAAKSPGVRIGMRSHDRRPFERRNVVSPSVCGGYQL